MKKIFEKNQFFLDFFQKCPKNSQFLEIFLLQNPSHQFIFNEDYKDGSLDLVLASGKSLFLWASIKIFVNWYFSSLPLIFLSLLTSFMLYLPFDAALILALTLFLGTPILSMFGALAGALTLERGNIVGSSIVIPMCLPALILGILAIQSYKNEELFFFKSFNNFWPVYKF